MKPQWDTISHLSKWLPSVNQQTTSGGKNVEKGEHFWLLGMQPGAATVESRYLKNFKNASAFWHSNPTCGNISEGMQNTNLKEHKHPMFIAALFTIYKIWKQPMCPSVHEGIRQLWNIYTVEYYSAIKKKLLPFATVWMDLENTVLSKISQSEKDKYHMISFMCGI